MRSNIAGRVSNQRQNNSWVGCKDTFKFNHSAADLNQKHALQTQTINDKLDLQLAQCLALILLEKNYETVESPALHALTAIMKDYLREIGKEVRQNAEM